MKIRDDNGLPKSLQPRMRAVQSNRSDAMAEGASAGKTAGDQVELSDKARALHAAKEALSQLPEVRQDRVADLNAQVKSGQYEVPAAKVAIQMLAESLFA